MKVVFLDLEETVIDVFGRRQESTLVNLAQVRGFLDREAPAQVRLFSFALADASSVERYRQDYQVWLDHAFGVSVALDDCFTTMKLFDLCRRHGTVFESDLECMLFHSKALGFQRYIEMSPEFRDMEVVLLDDAVEPMQIFYPRRNLTVRLVNVTDL